MRKRHCKYVAALLLSALFLLAFSACGEDTPDAGKYLCVSAEADGFQWEPEDLFPDGVDLELGSGGKGVLVAGDLSGTFRWNLSGTKLSLHIDGQRASGTLQDGVLDLSLSGGQVLLHFLREDLVQQLPPSPEAEDFEESLSRWCGDWFGRWTLNNVEGSFPETWYDCCASVSIAADDRGLILRLWDEDGARDEPMGLVEFSVDPEEGTARSTQGNFWFQSIGPGEWVLDSYSGGFPDMIVLRGHHDSRGETFDYEIVLRPWGRAWDDVAKKDSYQLPFRYEWYLKQIETGQPMPDSLPLVA